MVFKFNKSNKKLLLLLGVFVFAILSQSVLNYSFSLANQELDNRNKHLFTVGILGENVVRKLSDIQSLFYQLVVSDGYKKRAIIQQEIQGKTDEITLYLNILERGGSFNDSININLPNTNVIHNNYSLETAGGLKIIGIDIKPKLAIINQKVATLITLLNALDDSQLQRNNFIQNIDEVRQFVKSASPLFVRTLENANRIYYEFIQQKQLLEKEILTQKELYTIWQILLTISILILGVAGFYVVGKQMRINNDTLQERQDYVHDILKSQSNIIIVNDGKNIIDASGGFFTLFTDYHTLEEFTHDYSCICDTFINEEGFLSKYIDDIFWVEYVANNPDTEHKAKIHYNNKDYIYTVSCIKSKKYKRYIISMFDVTQTELIKEDLKIQKDKAIKAAGSKGEFLANMNHEIRTPLNAILGFIALLKEKPLDDEGKKYLNTIESSGQSLLAIVNDVLDYSKIESSKLVLDPIDFNTQTEFNILANLFTKQCEDKNITLHTHFADTIPNALHADIIRIKQVITNLLSNAVKFTPDNKNITFTIGFKDNLLSFAVKDEGIGISSLEQKHIFKKFSQAKSSTTREYGGTGLGLAISSKLVELLGGKIQLKSTEDVGSTFSFTIPVQIAQHVKNTQQDTSITGFSGKVLLAEDNKTNQMLMRAIFNKQGVDFDIANDGQEAVEMATNNQYDLIFMDNHMPRLSGIDACKQIRTYETAHNHKQTPIVALTASTTLSDREKFIAIGMNDYLSKPIEIPKLMEVFTKFLA
jgi:CheY-like chemotaxis protein/nitrogen-specific signal transduction histidine kinase